MYSSLNSSLITQNNITSDTYKPFSFIKFSISFLTSENCGLSSAFSSQQRFIKSRKFSAFSISCGTCGRKGGCSAFFTRATISVRNTVKQNIFPFQMIIVVIKDTATYQIDFAKKILKNISHTYFSP